MRRYIAILVLLLTLLPSGMMMGQTKGKKAAAKKPQKTAVAPSKTTRKTARPAVKQSKKTVKPAAKGKRGAKGGKKAPAYETTAEIKGLQNQRSQLQRDINTKERELKAKESDVRNRLQNLVQINTEIDQRQKSIDTIQSDLRHIDGNIGILKGQLTSLEAQLGERREKFIKSMRYMSRHRNIQDKLLFIFSAKSLSQMYRRMRFVHEYAAYQRAQGKLLQQQQQQVDNKHRQLREVRGQKSNLLQKGQRVKAELQGKHAEQEKVVQSLQAEQKTLQGVLAEQRKKQAALNHQIDNLIAIEIRKARERAAAEARARAAAEAAARKKRAEEAARRKAAAEAAARERQRKIAEAKAREAKAKEEARAAARAAEEARRKAAAEAAEQRNKERAEREAAEAATRKARAEQMAREAEAERIAAERKAAAEGERLRREEEAEKRREAEAETSLSTEDRRLTGSFANNRGRLPMPMSGRIVSHYGQYNVEGLKGVQLSNSGINIKAAPGTAVRSVFAGEVSAVFGFSGTMVVMVRHGSYISVYCNLRSVSVSKGQKVAARQTLGAVGQDGILQFQLRKEAAKLNPEAWLGR